MATTAEAAAAVAPLTTPAPAPATAAPPSPAVSTTQAITYLTQFIGRNLRIHVTDKRMFIGQMKCTDKDRNIILGLTHEYRPPSDAAIRAAIASSGDPSIQLPLSSRYVGLVVVPGRYITKVECEETPWAPAPVASLSAAAA
ncbi:lsm domain-containing protein [Diplodia corticola]|uniref:Lsm domain-containing protein n=1 Tax=Diplodia corticola TaxID=236234 RepID=A0A1J9S114_9PEZI|nr:lsm domain-containing protein [Diplodia corticola]OJD33716.1 lsm domain-containing protein [Diplodia corticola]